jgi:hypothetical protein
VPIGPPAIARPEGSAAVPLSLGGAPWDTRNLWHEPLGDARREGDAEAHVHHLVGSRRMLLAEVQANLHRTPLDIKLAHFQKHVERIR